MLKHLVVFCVLSQTRRVDLLLSFPLHWSVARRPQTKISFFGWKYWLLSSFFELAWSFDSLDFRSSLPNDTWFAIFAFHVDSDLNCQPFSGFLESGTTLCQFSALGQIANRSNPKTFRRLCVLIFRIWQLLWIQLYAFEKRCLALFRAPSHLEPRRRRPLICCCSVIESLSDGARDPLTRGALWFGGDGLQIFASSMLVSFYLRLAGAKERPPPPVQGPSVGTLSYRREDLFTTQFWIQNNAYLLVEVVFGQKLRYVCARNVDLVRVSGVTKPCNLDTTFQHLFSALK